MSTQWSSWCPTVSTRCYLGDLWCENCAAAASSPCCNHAPCLLRVRASLSPPRLARSARCTSLGGSPDSSSQQTISGTRRAWVLAGSPWGGMARGDKRDRERLEPCVLCVSLLARWLPSQCSGRVCSRVVVGGRLYYRQRQLHPFVVIYFPTSSKWRDSSPPTATCAPVRLEG